MIGLERILVFPKGDGKCNLKFGKFVYGGFDYKPGPNGWDVVQIGNAKYDVIKSEGDPEIIFFPIKIESPFG